MTRQQCFQHLRSVETNYQIVHDSTDYYYLERFHNFRGLSAPVYKAADVKRCSETLGDTFILEMFAIFEAILRDYWSNMGRASRPKMADLLDGIAARHRVPLEVLELAHLIREYRNWVVHNRFGEPPNVTTIAHVRKYLCNYLSYFPLTW